jgi:hypothetical protein
MEKKWPLTRAEMAKYVGTLDTQVQHIYQQADDLLLTLADTLEDDFQIVADILDIFQAYARRRQEIEHFVSADDPLGYVDGENIKFELAFEPIPGTLEIPGMVECHDFTVSGKTLIFKDPPLARPLTNYKRRKS